MLVRFSTAFSRILACFTLILLGAGTAVPQPATEENDRIAQIRVEGNRRIEAETIRSYMLLQAGDPFDAEQLDLSLKTLFATGLFSDVVIDRQNKELLIQVVENPIINQVIFEGNRAMRTDRLEEETEAEPRAVFTQARVQKDVQRILDLYRRSGRFSVSVSPEYRRLEQNRVDLIFVISEGAKTGVRAVNFIGNEHFPDSRLRTAIITNVSRWWRIFDRNDNYDPDRLEYDRELLRQFYSDNGFANFHVKSAVAALTPDQEDFFITFTISEGQRYNFGKIEVQTSLGKLQAKALQGVLPMKSGDMYQGSQIEAAMNALVFTAGSAGYANVDVRPVVERNSDSKMVDVTFVIDEGPLVYIERIDISGNTRTLEKVIRREIRLSEGDAFNRVLLDSSRTRLRALRFFSEVKITESPGSREDRTIVHVDLEEQATGSLSLSLGYSTVESFLANFEIKQANFGGRGQYLGISAKYSTYSSSGEFSFTEPKFLGSNVSLGSNIFVTDYTYFSQTGYANLTAGLGVTAQFPLSKRRQLQLNYDFRYNNLRINQNYSNAYCDASKSLSVICEQAGLIFTSSIGYAFVLDRLNDPVVPTGGYYLRFNQSLAGLGGNVRYLSTEMRASAYQDLFWGMVASFKASAGYITGYAGDSVRINDLFRRGGFTFRGFQYNGLGPREFLYSTDKENDTKIRNERGLALGGKLYAMGTVEVSFPIPYLPEETGLSAGLFLEFGTVTMVDPYSGSDSSDRVVEDSGSIRASAGLSLFWDTYIGPLQFDFSTIIKQEKYDEIETFRFSTRARF